MLSARERRLLLSGSALVARLSRHYETAHEVRRGPRGVFLGTFHLSQPAAQKATQPDKPIFGPPIRHVALQPHADATFFSAWFPLPLQSLVLGRSDGAFFWICAPHLTTNCVLPSPSSGPLPHVCIKGSLGYVCVHLPPLHTACVLFYSSCYGSPGFMHV
jgi:hypothetical protein